MTKTELQEIGKEIRTKQIVLIAERRVDWELGRYSLAESYKDAIKEICLLK